MLSIGFWRWYINITIEILDTILGLVFYLKHDVSKTLLYIYLQVEATKKSTINMASLSNNIYRVYKPTHNDTVNKLGRYQLFRIWLPNLTSFPILSAFMKYKVVTLRAEVLVPLALNEEHPLWVLKEEMHSEIFWEKVWHNEELRSLWK
jgi:hypothetical protein